MGFRYEQIIPQKQEDLPDEFWTEIMQVLFPCSTQGFMKPFLDEGRRYHEKALQEDYHQLIMIPQGWYLT